MKSSLWIERIILSLIIILAGFLYFYRLGELPNSLSDDEAIVGYNAFSILSTGKDEFGKSFPIAFRFFGAYTPPLFVYLSIPFIKVMGLNAAAIRIPSGLSTLIGILVIYYFVKSLKLYRSGITPLLTAFIFSTTPWVIYYARVGYEVTFGYIVFSLGALFIWRGITINKLSLTGLLLLSISTYIAHTERYLVPIFLLLFIIFFHTMIDLGKNRARVIWAVVLLLATQVPNLYLVSTKAFWVKNSVFESNNIYSLLSDFVAQLLTYYSPLALFGGSPDINLQHTSPEIGLFFSWLIIPFFIGLYQLYLKLEKPGAKYLVLLLVTAPIPGALSGHFISVQRVLPLIVPLVLIIGLGFDWLLRKIPPGIFFIILTTLFIFSGVLFWRSYWVLFPKERFAYWSYGFEQLADMVKKKPEIEFVIDSSRSSTVYSGMLFFLQFPPEEYQKRYSDQFRLNYYSNPVNYAGYKFANVDMRPIKWNEDPVSDRILVGDSLSISGVQAKEHFLEKAFEIDDPNNKSILFGYRTNPNKKIIDNRIKESNKVPGSDYKLER